MYIHIHERLLWFLVCVNFLTLTFADISCRNQNGKPVDWFIIYKLPDVNAQSSKLVQEGLGFLYLDESMREWQLSEIGIDSTSQALSFTLQQLYDMKDKDNVYHLMYNDEHPNGKTNSYRGHTKGVQLFDEKSGFWLIHSVPHFPPNDKYEYPESGGRNGQSMLCVTFDKESLGEIAEQLFFYQTSIYSSGLPSSFAQNYPKLSLIIGNKSLRKGPFNRMTTLTSKNGQQFISFAKHKKWNLDLYADFVAPELRETFFVETWLNGPNDLPSQCETTFNVYNLRSVEPDQIEFRSSKDHSKWAVSDNSQSPWICIGDINRQKSQDDRAGGTLCFENQHVWLNFRKTAERAEKCGHANETFQVDAPIVKSGTIHVVSFVALMLTLILMIENVFIN